MRMLMVGKTVYMLVGRVDTKSDIFFWRLLREAYYPPNNRYTLSIHPDVANVIIGAWKDL